MRTMDTIPTLKIGKIKGFILIALLLIPLNVYGFERLNAEEIALEAVGISIGISGACVVNNFSIGLGMGF